MFPKDYEAFFSGRPMEYMKKGVDGVKIGYYPSFASFELITIPIFEPNNYPNAKRFYMFDPMPNVTNREEKTLPLILRIQNLHSGLTEMLQDLTLRYICI